MKLLLDQNLSRKLVTELGDAFPGSSHVTSLDLDTASDAEIWDYAREHGYVIASKDSDFRQLAFLHGPPPKVVWLRVGNVSTARVLEVIRDHLDDLLAFDISEDAAFLVIPRLPS